MNLSFCHKGQTLFGVLVFFICLTHSYADSLFFSSDPNTSLAHFPIKIVDDFSNIFVSENIAPFVLGGMATALDWSILDRQNALASDLNHLNIESFFDFGTFYGEGWLEGGGALGSWGIGALTQDLRLQEFGRDMTESLIDSTVLVTGLKYAVDRTRPNGSPYSFPSGHTITAFCVAPIINQYGGIELGISAYALATVTGLARIDEHYHYLSDVIAGATLGIILGNSVVYKPKSISVSAIPGGLRAIWSFN
jgi:membrane-associated phospholipid phosphatase